VKLLEAIQGGQRLRNPVEMPLGQRDEIDDIPILGHLHSERFRGSQRLCVTAALRQFANTLHFELDGGLLQGWKLRFHSELAEIAPGRVAGARSPGAIQPAMLRSCYQNL
jgi:hypothetical protein